MSDEASTDIVAENCGEDSFQEGLSWRDRRRIAEIGVLAEALGKCCGEGCNSTLDLRNTKDEIRYGFIINKHNQKLSESETRNISILRKPL